MAKGRIDYRIKILYFLGMIFIVSGHIENGGVSLFYEWFPLYSFHLALFAFCSGYMHKKGSEKNIKQYITKKFKKLIIPVFLFNIFYCLLVSILSNFGFTIGVSKENLVEKLLILPITNGHQFAYNMGGWFVIPLFMILIFNIFVQKYFHYCKKIYIYFIYIIIGIIGMYLASRGYNYDWWLVFARFSYLLQFFAIGLIYKDYLEQKDKISNLLYFLIIFTISIIIIFKYGEMPYIIPSWCNNVNNGPIMPLISGIIGIAFWLRMAKILTPVIGKSKIVNIVANNSYYIMINQFLGFMIVKGGFAILSILTPRFKNFDFYLFKTDIWYIYLPKGLDCFKIIYLFAGIVIPIVIGQCIQYLNNRFKKIEGV